MTVDIIKKCMSFLERSSKKYSMEIAKQTADLNSYGGNFWTDELKKNYHRTSSKKLCLTFSDWPVLANAIVSPYSNSSWHVELINRAEANEDVQGQINTLEQDSDYKLCNKSALLRGVICGSGFVVVTTDIDYISGEPKVLVEFVQRQDSVALDPDIETVDGSDAEEGAIVNYISINKAKRLYGEDVLPFDYPHSIPKMDFTGVNQWQNEVGKVQVVSYYCKNESGTVTYYKICGNKVLEEIVLPIKFIPIVRFAGYQQYTSDGVKYSGIVDKTFDLQLGLNIAYSTLMERSNRSIKANLIASTDAVEGLDQYYKKMNDDDGLMILHNKGTNAPVPVIEQFQTADLREVIQQTRELIADVIGVPLAGIIGNQDKTATEILIQNTNKESNVACFYDNAYKASRTIGRIVIELLNDGHDVLFELENGPDVITNNMKHRQELQAVASLLPPEMQSIVAVHMLDTIDSKFSNQIKSDVIANLNTNIKLTTNAQDPYAVHQLKQMQELLDNTMNELEQVKMDSAAKDNQINTLQMQLMNTKERNIIDYQKMIGELQLKEQELQMKAQESGMELEANRELETIRYQKELLDLEKKKMELTAKMMGGV